MAAPLVGEYHLHTYFFQNNDASRKEALAFRSLLTEQIAARRFMIKLNVVNDEPRGPHLVGSFETWVPAEALGEVLGFFMLHRGSLPILLHPLTREEVKDHTNRAMWLGQSMPLDLTPLSEMLQAVPSQR